MNVIVFSADCPATQNAGAVVRAAVGTRGRGGFRGGRGGRGGFQGPSGQKSCYVSIVGMLLRLGCNGLLMSTTPFYCRTVAVSG